MPPCELRKILHVAKNATLEKLSQFQFKTEMHQIRFQLGLHPRSLWGSLKRSPDPLAGFNWSYFGREGKGAEKRRGKGGRRKRWMAPFLYSWIRHWLETALQSALITRKLCWRKEKGVTAVPIAKKSTANQRYAIFYCWLILTVAVLLIQFSNLSLTVRVYLHSFSRWRHQDLCKITWNSKLLQLRSSTLMPIESAHITSY